MELTHLEMLMLSRKLNKPKSTDITKKMAVSEYKDFVKLAAETNASLLFTPPTDPAFTFLVQQLLDIQIVVLLLGKMIHESTDEWAIQITANDSTQKNLIDDLRETFTNQEAKLYSHRTFLLMFGPEDQKEVLEYLKEYRTSFTLIPPEYFNAFPRK